MSEVLKLTAANLSTIAKQLVGPLTQQITANLTPPEIPDPQPQVVNTVVREHKQEDKIAEAYDEEEIALIRELKCPRLFTTRGKNGRSTTTNLTSQALQTLRDERADRKNWKHRV